MALICVSDRYTQNCDRFNDLDDFLAMCRACFGSEPELTCGSDYNGDTVWRDNEPDRHIVLVEEADFRRDNPTAQIDN